MTRERILMFVDRALECRKLYPEIFVTFSVEANSEELIVHKINNTFFNFTTHPSMKTKSFDNIVHIQDPDLVMAELFLNFVMDGHIEKGIERLTEDAKICRAGATGAEGSD